MGKKGILGLLVLLILIGVFGVVSAGDLKIIIFMEGEIVSPEPGYVSGDVNITWVNVENASLKYQEGLCNGSLNGTVLKDIHSEVNGFYDWDTATVDDGPYCIKLTWNSSVLDNVSVIVDNTAPTVVLTDNHTDNIVRDADTILITANFTETLSGIDETNIPKITIGGLVTDVNMTNQSNLVWNYSWNVPSGSDGLVNVVITAIDVAGNPNTAATGKISYTIDNIIPNLTSTSITGALGGIFSPANQDGLYDSINILMDASELVDWGTLYIKDSLGNNVKWYFCTIDWTLSCNKTWDGTLSSGGGDAPDGTYTINTTIADRAGNSNTIYVGSVIVDNSGPSITNLDNYTADGVINNDDNVIINATIIDGLAGISEIWLEWEGTETNHTLTQEGDSYYYNFSSTYLENQQIVEYQWFAKDVLGNLASSSLLSFQVENRFPIFNSSNPIEDLSGMEDIFSATINLSEHFYDLDVDDLTYTSTILSLDPGITSSASTGIIINIDNIAKTATILSTDDWNGNGTIVFYAWDFVGASVSSNTVYITIEADENDPPILGASITSPINFSEDTSINFNLNCNPPESDQTCGNFRYDSEYVSYDDNLIVNVNSLTGQVDMSATQDWNGVTYVKFIVDDNGIPMQTGEIVVKISVTPVNDNPILNIPTKIIEEGDSGFSINLQSYTLDVDNNVLSDISYTLVSQSNDTLISCELSISGQLNCNNPLSNAYGISELIIEVEDGSGGVGNQQFVINVTSVNDAPVINPSLPTNYNTDEDVPFTIDLNNYEFDVDPYDGDAELTWSVSGVDESLLLITIESVNDLLIVTPLENQYGSDSITLILTDSLGAQDTQLVNVVINPVNDAPVLDVIGTQNLFVGKPYSYAVIASDVDSSPSFSDNTSLFVIGATTGVISFTPISSGEYYVNISVSDGEFVDWQTVVFNVVFENEVPIANNVNIATDEDTNVLITLDCTDADVGDVLNYVIVTNPSNGTLSGSGNTRTYYPDTNYNGLDSFTYKCSDGLNESNIATVDITVTSVNDALRIVSYSPTFNPIIRTGTQDFSVVVEDFDSTVTYVWEVDGSSVGTNSNSYTYTSSSDGEFVINVTAGDGDNTVSHEWILTVSSVPIANTFTGLSTTDFSTIPDLSSASGVVLENDYGKIEFLAPLDLSDVFDLDNNVYIGESVFAIDTSIYPQLNKPARITLIGLSYTSVPEIFYSNQFTTILSNIRNKCYFCEIISYTGFPTTDGIVIFEVEHFSSFAVIGSGIKYNLSEFEDLEMCVEGEQGSLIVEIEEPSNRDDFGPGDEIEIEVNVKNGANEDKKIIVEAYLYNVDEDEEVEDVDSEYEEIRDGRNEDFEMIIVVPDDFEEDDDYILFVKAYEKGDEEIQCSYDAIEVQLEREKHKLIISKVIADSSQSYPGGSLELSIEVENIGGEDEEDVYITVKQSDLGIDEKGKLFEIEQYGDDDRITERFKIDIPKNALVKDYDFEIEVVYDDGEDSKLATVSIITRTVFEPVERLDVIELTKQETVISLDKKPVSKISIAKRSTYEIKNPVLTLLVILIVGIIIELIAIAIIRRHRKR